MKNKRNGLAVDIDETLSNTIEYWVKIMQKKFGNPENLSARNLIKKYSYTQNVPYWQTKEALSWMEKMRENNTVQEHLPLIENSNEILNKIHKIIPIVAYLTLRPKKIIQGTERFLKKHNFPKAKIICRPKNVSHANGNQWKAKFLEKNYPKILGIIDDNPAVIDNISKKYKGIVLLYNKKKYYKKEIRVINCKTWEDILKNLKKTKLPF
jgi:hypothetical protein